MPAGLVAIAVGMIIAGDRPVRSRARWPESEGVRRRLANFGFSVLLPAFGRVSGFDLGINVR